MDNPLKKLIRANRAENKIGFQLVVIFLLISTSIALLTTCVQLYIDYKSEMSQIDVGVHEIEQGYLQPIAESVWSFDKLMVQSQIDALTQQRALEHIRIVVDGEILMTAGSGIPTNTVLYEFPLTYEYKERSNQLGALEIYYDLDVVYAGLFDRMIVILATNFIKTFLVAITLLFFVWRYLTKPLSNICSYVEEIDHSNSDNELNHAHFPKLFGKQNELSALGAAIKDVHIDLASSFKQLQSSNDELDRAVKERTLELEEAKNEAIKLARTDFLTGLNNRRAFLDYAEKEHVKAARSFKGYTLGMIDVDHFKEINDHYSHAVGDKVLQAVAQEITRCVRASDISGRLGGEEFVVLLPETKLTEAAMMKERLRESIANISEVEGFPGQVTVSIGLASWGRDRSLESVLNEADATMYEAKSSGRNCVKVSSTADSGVGRSSC